MMTMINAVTLSLKPINDDDDDSKTIYITSRACRVFDEPNLTTLRIQSVLAYLWVLGTELPSCHPFGA